MHLQAKRGDSDLQCLQSCVSMLSEMETVYLEDITATRPHFKAIRSLGKITDPAVCVTLTSCTPPPPPRSLWCAADEVSGICSGILQRERESLVRL